jgi:hypothetical protein
VKAIILAATVAALAAGPAFAEGNGGTIFGYDRWQGANGNPSIPGTQHDTRSAPCHATEDTAGPSPADMGASAEWQPHLRRCSDWARRRAQLNLDGSHLSGRPGSLGRHALFALEVSVAFLTDRRALSLAEGRSATCRHYPADLPAGCYTRVVVGHLDNRDCDARMTRSRPGSSRRSRRRRDRSWWRDRHEAHWPNAPVGRRCGTRPPRHDGYDCQQRGIAGECCEIGAVISNAWCTDRANMCAMWGGSVPPPTPGRRLHARRVEGPLRSTV